MKPNSNAPRGTSIDNTSSASLAETFRDDPDRRTRRRFQPSPRIDANAGIRRIAFPSRARKTTGGTRSVVLPSHRQSKINSSPRSFDSDQSTESSPPAPAPLRRVQSAAFQAAFRAYAERPINLPQP